IEQHPAEIVKPQRREHGGGILHGLFNRLAVLANRLFSSGLHLRDDCEAVIRRSSWIDRAITALLTFEISFLGDRHCGRLCLVRCSGRGWLPVFTVWRLPLL